MLHIEFSDAWIISVEVLSIEKSLCVWTEFLNWSSVPKIVKEKDISFCLNDLIEYSLIEIILSRASKRLSKCSAEEILVTYIINLLSELSKIKSLK